ncbi:uncharacterized protein LOC110447933 [Mizuhopecten yessoensis]|uniref:uncharacterized protein LOC110447933 n=1 Tax=Mizuhopecten yessoensis TaxID=6573 RepID=UPI000B45BCB9|nr:uncharacterized protein LOC110447933 [Mizuhopecten yessoensis]
MKMVAIIAVVIAAVLLLGIVVGIVVGLTQNVVDDAACQFLTNEIICPFEREYKRIDILSPPVYLKNGAGRTSYKLSKGTDIRINGFLIKVTDTDISVRKQPSECAEEGEYPIIFSRENNSQSETKLPLKIKDFNDTMQMEIIPFTNTSDNERYVQFICTGYHQCGTVVMDLELQAPVFGTYNTPMECSRTNIDGTVMDKYGYACTLIMGVEMFQRTDNLKCKPTVETLENTKTTSIAQKSIDVNETTRSHFILRKLANETIKWNVNVQTLKDIRHLQTKYNGDFHGNKFDLDDRVKLSISVKGSIATCHVVFSPVTCIDEGPWELHLLNSTQHKEIQVTGTSTITACPSLVNGTVSEKLELKFTSCVPDDVRTYALNLYGKTNRRGSFLKDKSIEVVDQTSYFRAHLHLNELSVIYTKEPITCADHMMIFMMSLQTKGGDTIQNITSLTNVIAGRDRYKTYSTGGDFRENIPSVVSLRVHLGCRPQNMTIHINGSLLASKYALSEDLSTGEKIFTKSFLFPKLRMQDNGTGVELHLSFNDDEGSRRNLSITQVIRVIPDTFCLGRPHGCNYRHPYNSNMWIACGEGLIAEFGNCQSGLVFVPTSCEGKCL